MKQANKDFTLTIPEPLLRRFQAYAASRHQSMSSLVAEAISRMVDQDTEVAAAKRRFFDRIRNARDRGTRGKIRWRRDELYER